MFECCEYTYTFLPRYPRYIDIYYGGDHRVIHNISYGMVRVIRGYGHRDAIVLYGVEVYSED